MGVVDFIPEVNRLGKIWAVWKLIYKVKQNVHINHFVIKHMAYSCDMEHALI